MDYQATTPLEPRVWELMKLCFEEHFGNAASRTHAYGVKAEEIVEEARHKIAGLIHASSSEIIFTSGATESNNLALKGLASRYRDKGNHIITCATEHRAVLDTCQFLEQQGFEVTYLPVSSLGILDVQKLLDSIRAKTILISVMAANNEIGVLQPISEIGSIAKEKGIVFHTDAAQAAGKIPIDVEAMGIDLMSISAHKMYGPKGVGALYVRNHHPRIKLEPLIHGGGHEAGLRSGTLNVPEIAGFGKACEIAGREMQDESQRSRLLREKLLEGICGRLEDVYVNGDRVNRLPNNLNLSFDYLEGESLLMGIKDSLAVSSGSACSSAKMEPSHVLKALGLPEHLIYSSIRFGIGRFTTDEEVEYAAAKVVEVVRKQREVSPLYEMTRKSVGVRKNF
jgi:cysteine desulfurase